MNLNAKKRNNILIIICSLMIIALQLNNLLFREDFIDSSFIDSGFCSQMKVKSLINKSEKPVQICNSFDSCKVFITAIQGSKLVSVVNKQSLIAGVNYQILITVDGAVKVIWWNKQKNLITINQEKWYKMNLKYSKLINFSL